MEDGVRVTMANPPHPGANLRGCIDRHGETVTHTAKRLGWSRAKVNRILAGAGSIHPADALALERIGWSSAEFWMRLQVNHDLAKARREADAA